VYATAQWREDRLQQQRQAMKDNYDKICSENQKLITVYQAAERQGKEKSKN